MIFTVEEKQILAMYDKGSAEKTYRMLDEIYGYICKYNDPLAKAAVLSSMRKLRCIEEKEYLRIVYEAHRPVGVY